MPDNAPRRSHPAPVGRVWPAAAAALVLATAAPAAAQPPKRVLVLYSHRHDLPMNQFVDARLRAGFRAALGDGVEVHSEYINVAAFPDRAGHKQLLEFLHHKHCPRGPDLIVAVASAALAAVEEHRDWFFPTTPVVFLCVAGAEVRARPRRPGVGGVPVELDFGESARVALDLRPEARRVVVVAGASPGDRAFAENARRDLQPLAGRVELVYHVGLPMDRVLDEVARLPADAVVLYIGITRDGADRAFVPRDALDQIAAVSAVPVFGAYDSYLGHGVVGGHVVSFSGEAENATRLGLRVLAGEDPAATAAGSTTACTHVFDWRQLRRWGIDEGRLPPGSVVLYRHPGVWEEYRWHVAGALAVVVVQGVLLAWLLAARVRRRRAEAELRASHREQRHLARQLLTAQEVERRRIAREMHDDLTQRLAVLAIEVSKLEGRPDLAGPVAASLGGLREQLVGVSEDVHDLSRQLHPAMLDDLGLADALRAECARFQEREGVEVRFRAEAVPADIRRDTRLGLYRIAQEALRNAARHSGAAWVEVSLLGCGRDILLSVADEGKGFDRAVRGGRTGIGLASMEERARLMGAELTVHSAPGKGTTVTVLLSGPGGES